MKQALDEVHLCTDQKNKVSKAQIEDESLADIILCSLQDHPPLLHFTAHAEISLAFTYISCLFTSLTIAYA